MLRDEITGRMHTILGQSMKDREADFVLLGLSVVARDTKDAIEFAKLFLAWAELELKRQ